MFQTYSVSVHGISGQGVETAISAIGKAAVSSGLNAQSLFFPTYERRGSTVHGIVKIDKNPIMSRQDEPADMCLLFDSMLYRDILPNIKNNGMLIVNTAEKLNVQSARKRNIKVFALDATGTALLTSPKKPIPNLAMLGAFAKIYGKLSMKSIKSAVESLAKDNPSMDEGFKNVKQVR